MGGAAGAATLGWTGLILVACLTPTSATAPDGFQLCLICSDDGVADLIRNVALYLPLGFLLRRQTGSILPAVALGSLLSLGVETAQLWIPGRFSTTGDLVANAAGAAIGAVLGASPRSWLLPEETVGRRLLPLLSLTVMLSLIAPGVLIRPAPPGGSLHGNWTPQIGGMPAYRGHILQAELDGRPLPSRALEDSVAVQVALRQGAPLVLRFEPAPSTPDPAPLFRLLDGEGTSAWSLAVEGEDLLVRTRTLADALHLASPALRGAGALGDRLPGDTVLVILRPAARGGLHLSVDGHPVASAGVTSSRGWAFLSFPTRLPPRAVRVFDLLWIALHFGAVGWWAGRPHRALAAGAAPLLVLILVPFAAPLLPPSVAQLLVAAAALLGAGAARAGIATRWGGRATELAAPAH